MELGLSAECCSHARAVQVGARTAETLQGQGEQMERVLDALHEIQFSMKKAGQVIRDITRGIATDK